MMTQHRLPPFRVLILCALALGFLLLRGLDIGPLHPDVLIHRAWLAEVGAAGFTERYLAVNQRHLLVGPVNAAAYLVFLTDDLPYQVIFQLGRLLSGVFLAGIVARLGGGMALAVCSGLALSLTSLRVDHLYQGINWYIEPTLTMLLASAYLYIGSIQTPLPNRRRALYALSFALYAVSVLIYEAGLPWLALNGVLGVALRRSLPWPARLWRAVVEMAPFAVTAGCLAAVVLFGMTPWDALRPDTAGALSGVARLIDGAIRFPARHLETLHTLLRYGDRALAIALWGAGAALAVILSVRRTGQASDLTAPRLLRYARFAGLALLMIGLSGLAAVGSASITDEYLDRIQFGQAAGIALLSCVALFALSEGLAALAARLGWALPGHVLGAVLCAALFIGPGLALTVAYRDFAAASRAEIEHLSAAILDRRGLFGRPLHLIVVTEPDWPAARFLNASDVILHEAQQAIWARGGDATLDILKVGALPDQYQTEPGTCNARYGEASAGPCLAETEIMGSRWAAVRSAPLENVVVARYDTESHTLRPVGEILLAALDGYNIGTAGPALLKSSPARLLAPIDQVP